MDADENHKLKKKKERKSQVYLAKLPWESCSALGCASVDWISEWQYPVNSFGGKNMQTIGNMAEYFLRLILL